MAGVTQQRAHDRMAAAPPDGYPDWDAYMLDVEQAEQAYVLDDTYRRGIKALRLAPSLAVYRALMAGQPVPVAAMDQRWRRRYGL